jgi:tRNA(Leu) C34 or U34 (ribose-2'-O)-methylase TrmL
MDVAIGLVDPKYPSNLGTIVRTAAAYDVKHVLFTGTRMQETLDNTERIPRELRMKEYGSVNWEHVAGGPIDLAVVHDHIVPVCVEFLDHAENLVDFIHPEHAIYIFGPEDGDVPQNTRRRCHRFVKIPTRYCLNLATAVATVLYDRACKV